MMSGDHGPPRDATLPPGYDEHDPYDGESLSEYPDWWRQNVEEFRKYNMRPYRPPRFADGTVTQKVISGLEEELDVEIRLRAQNPREGEDWQIWINETPVAAIGRSRDGDGYTVYEMSTEQFSDMIRMYLPPSVRD